MVLLPPASGVARSLPPPGATSTLPAIDPSARPTSACGRPSSPTSSGSTSGDSSTAPPVSSDSGLAIPPGSYSKAPVTSSSFSRTRLGSRAGGAMPLPTSTRRPPVVSWAQRRCHRGGAGPSTRSRRRPRRPRGDGARPSTGRRGRRAPPRPWRRRERARSRRAWCGSLTTTSSTPRARSAATTSRPIGPPPETRTRWPRRAPLRVTPWSATASGSARAAVRRRQARRHRHDGPLVGTHVGGERAVGLAACRAWRATGTARAGRRRQERQAPHPGAGPPTTGSPTATAPPSPATARTMPDHSWPPTVPGRAQPSRARCRSVPHTPQWLTSTSTCVPVGQGTGRSSTRTSPGPCTTAARIVGPDMTRTLDPRGCSLGSHRPPPLTRVERSSRGGEEEARRQRAAAGGGHGHLGRGRGTWRSPASPHSCTHASWRKP